MCFVGTVAAQAKVCLKAAGLCSKPVSRTRTRLKALAVPALWREASRGTSYHEELSQRIPLGRPLGEVLLGRSVVGLLRCVNEVLTKLGKLCRCCSAHGPGREFEIEHR